MHSDRLRGLSPLSLISSLGILAAYLVFVIAASVLNVYLKFSTTTYSLDRKSVV